MEPSAATRSPLSKLILRKFGFLRRMTPLVVCELPVSGLVSVWVNSARMLFSCAYAATARSITASAFELYEWHTTQEGTGTKPGGTVNLDYSIVRSFPFAQGARRLQLGLVGYLQRQTTAKTGPEITAEQSRERYAVNALGLVSNLVFPKSRVSVGIKYFDEFANRAAYEGYSFQVSGAISF